MVLYILYDNNEWIKPLCKILENNNISYHLWLIDETVGNNSIIDFSLPPPNGIFYNRN